MASPSRPVRRRLEATESQLSLLALSDDLLEEISLRVGSPADLARASTACAASSPTPPSSAATAPSTRRSSWAYSTSSTDPIPRSVLTTTSELSRRPTPMLLSLKLFTAPPTSLSATSLLSDGSSGISATSATAAYSLPIMKNISAFPTWPCAIPCPGNTCFCLPLLTAYSPPSNSSQNIHISKNSRPPLCLLVLGTRRRRHSK
ncbi:hypothetical protein PVAP13_2KG478205 [Panicum virgatum]|uniref:Uncharacterized protein n=1 Tax=Panicum virgatum TaxID=38727 RepID=A0A8T0WJL1_PANVG|nr:hypothetical protein PVAP13_2KG478205 [Panicum virgatum]